MGDKLLDLESGILYFGDVRFGEFKCDECEFNERKFADDEVYLKIPSSKEATFTATFDATYLIRRLCPNNWLKMHGYPMRRRRFKK